MTFRSAHASNLIKQMVHMQLNMQTVDFDLSIMDMLALNFSLRIEIRRS